MLANNIWKLTGKLFEWAFGPYEFLRRDVDSWWGSNIVSWILMGIGLIALLYWMNMMFQFKKEGKEDEA